MTTPNAKNAGSNTGSNSGIDPQLNREVDEAFDRIRLEEDTTEELDDSEVTLLEEEPEKAAEEYAGMKGADVSVPRKSGEPIKGKLVEWDDPNKLIVVFEENKVLKSRPFKAPELYRINPELRTHLAQLRASKEGRDRLTSLFQDEKARTINQKEINNGGQAETLAEAIHHFEMPGGIEGVAATSIAGYKYEMDKHTQLPKNRNEDAWIVNPETGYFAVVDALGEGKMGPVTTETVATALSDNENDPAKGAKTAQEKMAMDERFGKKDGAVFMTGKIEVGKPIDITQCGDVDLYHFNAQGKPKYKPSDYSTLGTAENPLPTQSLLDQVEKIDSLKTEEMPPSMNHRQVLEAMLRWARKEMSPEEEKGLQQIMERYDQGIRPFIQPDNPLYSYVRRVVRMGINKKENKVGQYQTPGNVEAGDWVLMMSDGVSDNLSESEIQRNVGLAVSRNWTPEQLTKQLSAALDRRIKLKAGVLEDQKGEAEKNHYKTDNATIIVMRVKPQTAGQTTGRAAA